MFPRLPFEIRFNTPSKFKLKKNTVLLKCVCVRGVYLLVVIQANQQTEINDKLQKCMVTFFFTIKREVARLFCECEAFN